MLLMTETLQKSKPSISGTSHAYVRTIPGVTKLTNVRDRLEESLLNDNVHRNR